MSTRVEITEDDGLFTAVDLETGAAGQGESKAMALMALATALGGGVSLGTGVPADDKEALRALAARVRNRFDEAGVDEADVDEAIRWARSQ